MPIIFKMTSVTRAMSRPISSHEHRDDDGVQPDIFVVPLGEQQIDAAQVGQICLMLQFGSFFAAAAGPGQDGQAQ